MVRRRIKERSKARFTEDMMAGAVKSVVEEGLSLRSAAQIHGVKLPTLQRYVHKKKNNPEINVRMSPNYTVRLVFTQEQEADLSKYLKICSKMSYGLTTNQVKKLAYETAIRDKIKVPTSWDNNKCAGRDWLMAFMKRCGGLNIIRPPSECSLSLLPHINPHYVFKYFQNLEEILTRIPSLITDNRIYNLGEISTTTVKKIDECVIEKEVNCGSGNEAGEVVTTCAFICTDGTFLPPVMIFPQNYLNQNVKITNGAPQGTFGCASPSGRMTQFLFGAALGHFISLSESSKNNPTLLICDNQESHISIAAVEQAMEAGVILLTLPPRSNNKLQPLDISILPSFKIHYNAAMKSWISNHPDTSFTLNEVAECVGEAYPKSFTPDNIKLGFKNTGIFPFEKNILETDLDFRTSLTSHGSRCQEGLNASAEFDNFGQPGPSQSRQQNVEPRISSQYFTAHEDFEISDFISQQKINKDLPKQRLYPDVEKAYMFIKTLENDMENYIRYKLVDGRIFIKKNVPHIFDCWKDKKGTALTSTGNCGHNSMRDTEYRFFRLPSEKNNGGFIMPEKQKRRAQWIQSLHRVDLTESKIRNMRVCSAHFIKGRPAEETDTNDPDYIPHLNMGKGDRKSYGSYGSSKFDTSFVKHSRPIIGKRNLQKIKTIPKEVEDNKEATNEEIESIFLNEDLGSPIGAESPNFDNGLESMQTSEVTNNDRQAEKNRTFVEHIYEVLMELPPSKANQVRHKIYNILFQAEEESYTFVNQIGSSSSTLDPAVKVKYEIIDS